MRRTSRTLLAAAAVLLIAPAASRATLNASKTTAQIGATVTVSGEVPTGDNSYEPAIYADWEAGGCPQTVAAARTAAQGDTTRGLGFATVAPGAHTEAVPITASVVVQRPRQRVCAYGGGGALAGSVVVTGVPRFPPLEEGRLRRSFIIGGSAPIRSGGVLRDDPLRWGLQLHFRGTRATLGILTCNRKRFGLIASRIHLTSSGGLRYSGPLRPDNSKNYDAPIPLQYNGRATFTLTGTGAIGASRLTGPIDATPDPGLERPAARRLGQWGSPVVRVRGTFRAPGFHPFPGQPACGPGFQATLNPSVGAPVNLDQGTASTDFGERRPDEAGTPFGPPASDLTPFPEIQVPSVSVSIGAGTNTVAFSARDLDDRGKAGWVAYAWDFGDGSVSADAAPSHTFAAPGTYTVRLTVTTATGRPGAATPVTVYVDP